MFDVIEMQIDEVGVRIDAIDAAVDHRFAECEQSAALRHLELMARLAKLRRLVDQR
jgi:hypothetical protein